MPSTSAKQAKFMRAVAHSPKFAKKVGVPQSVGKDFEMADKKKVKKFGEGGWGMKLPRRDDSSIKKLPTKMSPKDESGIKKLPTKMPSKDGSGIKKFGDGGDAKKTVKKLKGPGPARPLEFPIRGRSISVPLDEPKPMPRKIPPKMVDFEPRQPKTGKAPANAPKPFEMTRGPDITVKGKSDRDEARKYREDLKKVKVSPAEGRVIESANRSEGGGHKKGGIIMKKATKAGRAMTKKSADTMGRAMVKKAGGGKCYAKGGTASARADGVAKKGKTKGKMLATGGLLSPGPKGTMVTHTNKKPRGVGATFANPRGMDTLPPRPAPVAAPKPSNMGANMMRRNKGGMAKKGKC